MNEIAINESATYPRQICDCGHLKSDHSDFTHGYGTDNNNKTLCYDCCTRADLKHMADHGKITLYFSHDHASTLPIAGAKLNSIRPGDSWYGRGYVSNWPSIIKFPVFCTRVGRHNFAGKRYDFWFTVPGDKFMWRGYTIGDDTQIAHCKRTKDPRGVPATTAIVPMMNEAVAVYKRLMAE